MQSAHVLAAGKLCGLRCQVEHGLHGCAAAQAGWAASAGRQRAADAARECWIAAEAKNRGERPSRFCVADEHYIPTLLAAAGRENETDCKARSGAADASRRGAAAVRLRAARRLIDMQARGQKVRAGKPVFAWAKLLPVRTCTCVIACDWLVVLC